MRYLNVVFPCLMSIAILFALLGTGHAAPPPFYEAVGEKELRETGEVPMVLEFARYNAFHPGILLPHPLKITEHISVPRDMKTTQLQPLQIHSSTAWPLDDIRFSRSSYLIHVRDGDIIPYYDHLLLIDYLHGDIYRFELVDKKVPSSIVPAADSRAISTRNELATILHAPPSSNTSKEALDKHHKTDRYEWIRVEAIEAKPLRTQVTLIPSYGKQNRVKQTTWAKEGETIQGRGGSLKIKKIVPPQDIKDVGHLVGWVEFEPVTDAEDK